ncbi:MAG TPA: hypothetical protein VG603_07500 [Chitinophagales bacterium]|nr:hypothetical protein [Chitinophagales bacterium]
MKFIARLTSVIFHPLLFPTYGTLLLILANPGIYGPFEQKLHVVWLVIIFMLTFVFPAVWVLMMRQLEMISSLKMESTKERIIPLVAVSTFYLWATWMFKPNLNMRVPTDQLIFLMMAGACISVFITFFLNISTKVSLHTLAAGSLVGLLLIIIRYSPFDLRLILLAFLLVAGLMGTAQLILKGGTQREVFIGYIVGFTGQFIAFTFVSRIIS